MPPPLAMRCKMCYNSSMETNEAVLSTQQALAVVSRRFPQIRTKAQLWRQVRLGALKVARTHGRKYYYSLEELRTFTPHYIAQGRNRRPPRWSGNCCTVREAAHMLGLRRSQLLHMIAIGRARAEIEDGAYKLETSEVERLKGETK